MTYLERMNQAPVIPQFPSSAAISGVSNTGLESIRKSQNEHPDFYPKSFSDSFNTFQQNVETMSNPNAPVNVPVHTSGRSVARSGSNKVKAVDYLNADLAKHYGMSAATAYQESLSNTAYQRSVKDMQAAGLNPVVLFGSGRAQTANASIYAADDRSSGGGYSRRYGSGSSGNGKLFSGSAYSAIQAIGGLIGMATTKRPDGFWIGSQTAKGAMGLLDAVWKR